MNDATKGQLSSLGEAKRSWRQRLRQRRREIPVSDAHAAAERAAQRLAATAAWLHARHIGTYLARDGEFDPAVINTLARAAGKRLYLPAVDGGAMRFRHWDPDRALVHNRYGIPEPTGAVGESQRLDILLLPLVGWTGSGFRLGMGGGYFDRYLADPQRRPRMRIGLAYECQREDGLEKLREGWDEAVDAVLTECALHDFAGRKA